MARRQIVKDSQVTQGQDPTIVLLDQRTRIVGPPLAAVATAIQKQVDDHFKPIWQKTAKVVATQNPPADAWVLSVVDQSSFGLGYHNYDPSLAHPFYGEITGTTEYWSITASHEVLEILINPYTWACESGYREEVCDPVENISYAIDSIYVSDFAYPSWFGLASGPQNQWDFSKYAGSAFDYSYGYIETCHSTEGVVAISVLAGEKAPLPPSVFRGPSNPLITALTWISQTREVHRG